MTAIDADREEILHYLDGVIDRILNEDINSVWILMAEILNYSDVEIKNIIEELFKEKLNAMMDGNIVIDTKGWLTDE